MFTSVMQTVGERGSDGWGREGVRKGEGERER